MFISELSTRDNSIRLVSPDINRDAPLGVRWLGGEAGRDTLRLMGAAEKDNRPTTLEQESRRFTAAT